MEKRLIGVYSNVADAYESILRLVGLGFRQQDIILLRQHDSALCASSGAQTPTALAKEKRAAAQRQLMRNAATVCNTDEACTHFFVDEKDRRKLLAVAKDLTCGRMAIFVVGPPTHCNVQRSANERKQA